MNKDYARRDTVIGWLANQILRAASPRYQAMIKGSINYGLVAAAIDELNGEERKCKNCSGHSPSCHLYIPIESEPCWCCEDPIEPRGEDCPWEGRMDGYCYSCASRRCDAYPDQH